MFDFRIDLFHKKFIFHRDAPGRGTISLLSFTRIRQLDAARDHCRSNTLPYINIINRKQKISISAKHVKQCDTPTLVA